MHWLKELKQDTRLLAAKIELGVTQWMLAIFIVLTLIVQIIGWSNNNRMTKDLADAVHELTQELKRFP